jgi:hypothetical protein
MTPSVQEMYVHPEFVAKNIIIYSYGQKYIVYLRLLFIAESFPQGHLKALRVVITVIMSDLPL